MIIINLNMVVSVEWLINSMKDILNDSLNQFKQMKK